MSPRSLSTPLASPLAVPLIDPLRPLGGVLDDALALLTEDLVALTTDTGEPLLAL